MPLYALLDYARIWLARGLVGPHDEPGQRFCNLLIRVAKGCTHMGKRLWDSRLRVDDEAEQSIDFKHRKWEFPITAKVRTVEECLCVRARVQCPIFKRFNRGKY